MERSVKAAKVLVPSQPDPGTSEGETTAAACPSSSSPSSSSNAFEAMEAFSQRLEDIIHTHGSAAGLLDKTETETEKTEVEPKGDVKDVSVVMQTLNKLSSPAEKLEGLVKKYGELVEERQQLKVEQRSSMAARCKLEALCRELQSHYNVLREETLQSCREEEEKRSEMTSHFQEMLKEIQAQIEQHSARNDRLCSENSSLTEKLESLMSQCELRDESVEKINRHRDLQHKLTEAKLQQANALLAEAEEKHKREKEYLLREAIDKTKKCFAMKEQELAMKKKLALYAQKFDEFQTTLAKSNEIYVRFKKEMDNMSEKMKKVEKESNVWKTRFENCNKALTDMIEERTEKGKDYDMFVIKIHKLENLCRSLQEERKGLYEKIKEVRMSNANISARVLGNQDDEFDSNIDAQSALLESDELQEIQAQDPVLTEDMSRLREEQAKLQELAESLMATPFDAEAQEDGDPEEDLVASAFDHFRTKPKVKPGLVSAPKQAARSAPRPSAEVEEVRVKTSKETSTPETIRAGSKVEAPAPETIQTEQKPEVQTQVESQVKPEEESQQSSEPEKDKDHPQIEPEPSKAEIQEEPSKAEIQEEPSKAEIQEEPRKPEIQEEPSKAEIQEETGEVTPEEGEKTQQQQTEETPRPSVSGPPSEQTSKTSNNNSSKKLAPKKKKKKGGKNAS